MELVVFSLRSPDRTFRGLQWLPYWSLPNHCSLSYLT